MNAESEAGMKGASPAGLSGEIASRGFLEKSPSRPVSSQKRRIFQPAFTLIELLVVILILAVMGAIVTPKYSRYLEKAKFEAQVREVIDLFAFAREKAVTTDSPVTLSYDPSNETFQVKANPPTQSADQPAAFSDNQNRAGVSESSQAVNAGVRLDDGYRVASFQAGGAGGGASQELHFLGDGTVEQATLTMTAKTGDSVSLQLSPATGRLVRMQEDSAQPQ